MKLYSPPSGRWRDRRDLTLAAGAVKEERGVLFPSGVSASTSSTFVLERTVKAALGLSFFQKTISFTLPASPDCVFAHTLFPLNPTRLYAVCQRAPYRLSALMCAWLQSMQAGLFISKTKGGCLICFSPNCRCYFSLPIFAFRMCCCLPY